jgi:hypothetical protein
MPKDVLGRPVVTAPAAAGVGRGEATAGAWSGTDAQAADTPAHPGQIGRPTGWASVTRRADGDHALASRGGRSRGLPGPHP